jgi:hypothetical protein
MQALLWRVLTETGLMNYPPRDVVQTLREDVAGFAETAELMGEALRDYLRRAGARQLDTVVLKGLSVSANVYGDPGIRPGGDVDLLVRREQVGESLEILEEMGLGQWWPNLLDDAYYARHHLHQQRCSQDLRIWFEVHWALDHPYTRLTIDYEAMMDRATPGKLLGEPLQDLSPPDLLMSLAVHLVKHAVYLPSVLERPDLARIILADGMLLYYVDVAEAIKVRSEEIDWQFTVDLAKQSGTLDIFGSVFRVCCEHLDAPVPSWVLDLLPIRGEGTLAHQALNRMADYEVVTYLGQRPSRFWEFMVVTNGAFILRPIRILDTASYCFPGGDYLERKYGGASWKAAARHLARAVGQFGRLGIDTLYYTWERHRRLKALGESASLFNRLEVDA